MVGSLLDLMDAVDRKLRFALNLCECLARDRPHLSVYFTNGDLYVQPFLELGLFRPKRAHFGQGVAFNHWAVTATDYADYTELRAGHKEAQKAQNEIGPGNKLVRTKHFFFEPSVPSCGYSSHLRNLRNLRIRILLQGGRTDKVSRQIPRAAMLNQRECFHALAALEGSLINDNQRMAGNWRG